MGCDIHCYVEQQQANGSWKPITDASHKPLEVYDQRSYNTFAILADVRNGHGFAGIKTGDNFVPISPPKGLPDDVSKPIEKLAKGWGTDGHSHSFLTLHELLSFDWTQTANLCGVVSAREYYDWVQYRRPRGEMPDSYYGDVSGGGVIKISIGEMATLIEEFDASKALQHHYADLIGQRYPNIYTHFQMKQPYWKCARHFWSDVMPRLFAWAADSIDGQPVCNLDLIRLVFWFDN